MHSPGRTKRTWKRIKGIHNLLTVRVESVPSITRATRRRGSVHVAHERVGVGINGIPDVITEHRHRTYLIVMNRKVLEDL